MSEKDQKKKRNASKSYDIVLIFITAFAAPLAAHVCDVTMGKENNPLSSEKLLCAYFALIATYVIYEFLLSCYKETLLWEKGWMLGNSDALIVSSYIVVTSIVIGYYDTLGGTLFLVILIALFIGILILKPNQVELSSRSMVLFALIMAVIIPAILANVFGSDILNNPERLAWVWLGQFFVCLVFDGAYVLIKKLIKKKDDKANNR